MLTAQLLQAIDGASETICQSVIQQIRHDPAVPTMAKLPEEQLLSWSRSLYGSLQEWMESSEDSALAKRFYEFGKQRFADHVPLPELIRAFHLWRGGAVSYVRGLGFEQTTLSIYVEEELEHDLVAFYEFALYHLARGYEDARSQTQSHSPTVSAVESKSRFWQWKRSATV